MNAFPHENRAFRNFRTGDLFDIVRTKGAFNACDLEILEMPRAGYHPYVVRTSRNNGVKGYVKGPSKALNPGRTISFAQDTAQIFYQSDPYFTGKNMKMLRPKGMRLDRHLGLYLVSILRHAFSRFCWGQSFADRILSDVEISLPVAEAGAPDWAVMALCTNHIEAELLAGYNQLLERSFDELIMEGEHA